MGLFLVPSLFSTSSSTSFPGWEYQPGVGWRQQRKEKPKRKENAEAGITHLAKSNADQSCADSAARMCVVLLTGKKGFTSREEKLLADLQAKVMDEVRTSTGQS